MQVAPVLLREALGCRGFVRRRRFPLSAEDAVVRGSLGRLALCVLLHLARRAGAVRPLVRVARQPVPNLHRPLLCLRGAIERHMPYVPAAPVALPRLFTARVAASCTPRCKRSLRRCSVDASLSPF